MIPVGVAVTKRLILVVVAALFGAAAYFYLAPLLSPTTLHIVVESENQALEPLVQDWAGREGVAAEMTYLGSVEISRALATGKASEYDADWPAHSLWIELGDTGKAVAHATSILRAPVVLGVRKPIAEGLGWVGQSEVTVQEIEANQALAASGEAPLYSVYPAKSNSGNIWAGLLAIVFNDGTPPTEGDLPALLPRQTAYFPTMGYMDSSSGDIFENFLKQGMGARPIIVGYENQPVEFLTANAQHADLINAKIRVIYPEPTVFASHPLISLTPACARLAEALQDPALQAIAWTERGYRTGLIGVENDPADIKGATLPATVDLVVPMPTARVMERIIAAVQP